MRAIMEVLLGELHQLRPDTLSLRLRRDRHRGDIGRTREAMGCEQYESESSRILIARDEQLGPRPIDDLAARTQIALQSDPGFGGNHQACTPFAIVWLRGLDVDGTH